MRLFHQLSTAARGGQLLSALQPQIPGILKSFRALHPGITVEVESGFCNSQLTAKLRANEIDLAIGAASPSPDLLSEELCADEMLCVMSADFELRNHWYVVSDDLQGLPNMISYGDYGEEALPVAQHMGITAGSSFASVDDTSLVALAESGLGFNRPDGKKQANNF